MATAPLIRNYAIAASGAGIFPHGKAPTPPECPIPKAAIDGVGFRVGKSGGSIVHQGLLMIFATVSASAHYVAGILMLVIVGWIIAVRSLGKQFASNVG